jgi:osmotically-inducible protein OsmY
MAHSAPEQEIADAVRRAFDGEPRLGPGFSLDRTTLESDGALLLEGEVARLAQKKLALLRASEVPGVTELVDRVHVAARMLGRHIRDRTAEVFALEPNFGGFEVCAELAEGEMGAGSELVEPTGSLAPGRIVIEESDGVVTLNGIVPSLIHKRLAGAMAWRVPGVRDVINGIAVEPPEEDGPDQIEEAVRVVLDSNPAIDAAQIKAGVRGRVVRLTGLAPSEAVREMAEDDCWAVFGVDDVVNEIDVRA